MQDLWAFPTGVSPFGYLRIKTHLQLPAAFRSLSRPSSAPSAKAFPLRSFLLDQSWFSQELLWQPFSASIVIFHYPFAKTEKPLNCPFKCLLYRCLFLFLCSVFNVLFFLSGWGFAPLPTPPWPTGSEVFFVEINSPKNGFHFPGWDFRPLSFR